MVALHNKECHNQGVTLPSIHELGLPLRPSRLAVPPLRSQNREHQLAAFPPISQSPAPGPQSQRKYRVAKLPAGNRNCRPRPPRKGATEDINTYITEVNKHGLGKCGVRRGCPNRQTANNKTTVSCDGDFVLTYCENCSKVTARTKANQFKHQVEETKRRTTLTSIMVDYYEYLEHQGYDFAAYEPLSPHNQNSGMRYEKIDILNAFMDFTVQQDDVIREQAAVIAHLKWLLGVNGHEVHLGEMETKRPDRASEQYGRPGKLRRLTPPSSPLSHASSPRPSL